MESREEGQEDASVRSPLKDVTTDTADTTSTANTADTTSTANTADTTSTANTADTTSTANTTSPADSTTAAAAVGTLTAPGDQTDIFESQFDEEEEEKEQEEVKEQEEEKEQEEVKEEEVKEEQEEEVMDEETETVQLVRGSCVAVAAAGAESAGVSGEDEDAGEPEQQSHLRTAAVEDEFVSEQKSSTPTAERPAPPGSLALTRPTKKKVLVAPALSLSLGRSESTVSDDFPSVFLSPSLGDDDDTGLDFDLDAMETPSDSESLAFPIYDLDLEDDLRRLGVASRRRRAPGFSPRSRFQSGGGCGAEAEHSELGALEREDMVDGQGTRWRCFSTGVPPQESRVNMSVLEPFLRVLSHGGYYGDGMNDIIVFSSCYLPQNSLENYQYVMDNLFRYVVGTLDLMVAENYVMVYLCAGGQKDKLPGISWLRECYTTIDRRLRKNLKGFYVVHPTWYIKALITIIKPFISSKFSRKLQFIDSLQDLSDFIPTEHVQIPDCVAQYDRSLTR